jgi:hypothetical protein
MPTVTYYTPYIHIRQLTIRGPEHATSERPNPSTVVTAGKSAAVSDMSYCEKHHAEFVHTRTICQTTALSLRILS